MVPNQYVVTQVATGQPEMVGGCAANVVQYQWYQEILRATGQPEMVGGCAANSVRYQWYQETPEIDAASVS